MEGARVQDSDIQEHKEFSATNPSLRFTIIDQKEAAKYKCAACKGLLLKPQQASCGHRFCSRCVSDLLMNPPPLCPEDSTLIVEVFQDMFAKRAIQSLQVQCSSRGQDGVRCSWCGQLQLLEEHKRKCEFVWVPCSNAGCQQVILRHQLSDHLQNSCFHGNIPCPRCRAKIAAIHFEEHKAECVEEDLQHQMRAASRPYQSFCPSDDCVHGDGDVCECMVVCRFCKTAVHSSSILDHHGECPLSPTCCPNGCTSAEIFRQDIDDHLKTCPKQVVKCFYRKYGCKFQGARCDHADHNKERQDYHLRLTSKLASQNKKITKSLVRENKVLSHKCALLEKRVSQLSMSAKRSVGLHDVQLSDLDIHQSLQDTKMMSGVFGWKISDFKRRRQDAISGRVLSMFSPPFYTSPAGYKFCARLYPNGDGIGRGTHLSLFFVVMRGEFDALLLWPFQQKVSLILLDQGRSNPHDVIETFKPDPSSSSFQRPKTDMNIASGCPLFAPLAKLNDSTYLRDNTLFLKVLVHPDSPQPPEKL